MARKPKTSKAPPNGVGHNSGEVVVDDTALLVHHLSKIRAQDVHVQKAKTEFDAARAVQNTNYRIASVDGFTRKELSELLADTATPIRDLVAGEKRRQFLRSSVGLPVASQMDLFGGDGGAEPKDEAVYRADGYLAGLRGDPGVPPTGTPADRLQVWLEGWGDGQTHHARSLSRAVEIKGGKPIDLKDDSPDVVEHDDMLPDLVASEIERQSPGLSNDDAKAILEDALSDRASGAPARNLAASALDRFVSAQFERSGSADDKAPAVDLQEPAEATA